MTTPVKTVAILDSRWIGHHPTYFREFLASLLRLEVRVIALCPAPAEFATVGEEVCRELGRDPADWCFSGEFTSPPKSFFISGMDHDPLSTMWRWFLAGRALRRAEAMTKWTADFVFFPWLDSYLRFLPHLRWTEWTLGRSWGGLYFRSHHLGEGWLSERSDFLRRLAYFAKGDQTLRAPQCKAVGVLDERHVEALAEVSGKPVLAFPDVADTAGAASESTLVDKIRSKAGNRKIIGMIGLEKRKGFLTLLKTAVRCSENRPWYFVFLGSVVRSGFDQDELEWLDVVDRTANEHGELDNTYLDQAGERIGEPEYNALLSSFDVIYAAYHDFPGSSNTLTKAAYFERPVIVSRGECMAKRVTEHRLGITVDQGDVDQTIEAIEKLLEGKNSDGTPLEAHFDDYRKLHSRERLDEVMRSVLDKAVGEGSANG